MRVARHTHENEQGANLVEMALVLPLMLLLTIGVVDIGRAFYSYISITNAAREGARMAAHYPFADAEEDVQEVVRRIQDEPAAPLAPWSEITAEIEGLGRQRGEPVVVTATLTYPTFIGDLVGLNELTLRSRVEMRIIGIPGM